MQGVVDFDIHLTANLPRNLPVKKILKSVRIFTELLSCVCGPVFLAQPVDKLGGSRMCLVPAAESVQRQFTAVADGVRRSSRSVSIMWLNFT